MKFLTFIISLLFVAGCSKPHGSDSPAKNCGDNASRCLNPTVMKFKTKDGDVNVSFAQVRFAKVNLDAPSLGSGTTIEKQFNDEFAIYVVQQLNLFNPISKPRTNNESSGSSEVAVGPIENLKITGEIQVNWQDAKSLKILSKFFVVLSGKYLQDFDFPDTYYEPSQILDEEWLIQQKTEHAIKP